MRVAHALFLGLLPVAAVHFGIRFAGVERMWVAVALYHAICVGVPALHRISRDELKNAQKWAVSSITIAVVVALAIWAVGREFYRRGWLIPAETRSLLLAIEPWTVFVVYSLAVNPFMEEWYWRAFLLPRSGIAMGGALFGLMHFAGFVVVLSPLDAALLSAPALASGFAWGWMRRASGSLWPCIVTHLGADAGILALFQLIRTTPSP